MASIRYLTNNFSAGEVGSVIKRRSDTSVATNGLEECTNMLVLPQGGLKSRPGTIHVPATITDTAATLKSFQYTSNDSVLAVVQGIDTVRVDYYNEASGYLNTETGYWSSARIANNQYGQQSEVLHVVNPLVKPYSRTGSTNFVATPFVDGPYLDINTTATTLTPSATSGTITFTASSITGINNGIGFQTTDVGRLFRFFDRGIVYNITAITKAAAGILTITQSGLQVGDSIYVTNIAGMTQLNNADKPYIVASVANNYTAGVFTNSKITLKDSETGQLINTSGYSTYTSSGYIQKVAAGTWHSCLIASRSSTTVITATISTSVEDEIQTRSIKALSSLIPQAQWRLGAWSDTTGFPKCVHFFGQRAVYAGNTLKPQTIWMSRIGDPTNFSPTTLPDAAQTLDINDTTYNAINWLAGDRFLRVGGDNSINVVNLELTNTYKEVVERAKAVRPVDLGTSTIFVSKDGKSLKMVDYEGDTTRLKAVNLNIHNDEIFEGSTIKKISLQNYPDKVLWVVTAAGKLCSLTLDADSKTLAWAAHVIGGANSVQDVEVITTSGVDRVWLLVNRTISAATVLQLEKLSYDFRNTALVDCNFLDSSKAYTNVSTCTGLTHLEGKVVKVLADGAMLSDKTVSSGSITLGATYAKVVVGLTYDRIIETLPLSIGGNVDSVFDTKAKITKAYVNVFESTSMTVGFNSAQQKTELFYTTTPALSTGSKEVQIPSGWEDTFKTYIKAIPGLPLTVLSITLKGEINA